ncbi:hypothetical protein ACFZDK_53340 [Streptomyces sp. NPDC007901]|uniref:hypothetical protein n=1 Tax=Streptomyces sp. NPDC007901 TaxID=3364785 RepID=UPI0036E0EECC
MRLRRERDAGPFYKQRAWVSSALFMAFLLVTALTARLSDDGGRTEAADSRKALAGLSGPLSPGDPQQVRQGPGGRPDNCRTHDQDTAAPSVAPRDVRWKQLVAIMVPTTPSAGPLITGPALWWCFAHTAMGAVLAAHVIPVELSGPHWRAAAEQQVVPGAARDRFVVRKIAARTTDPSKSAAGRFAGFSVSAYASTSATVNLLVTNPLGGYLSTPMSLRWRDGDWKLALRDDGYLYSATPESTPVGFVMWGA